MVLTVNARNRPDHPLVFAKVKPKCGGPFTKVTEGKGTYTHNAHRMQSCVCVWLCNHYALIRLLNAFVFAVKIDKSHHCDGNRLCALFIWNQRRLVNRWNVRVLRLRVRERERERVQKVACIWPIGILRHLADVCTCVITRRYSKVASLHPKCNSEIEQKTALTKTTKKETLCINQANGSCVLAENQPDNVD